MSLVGGWVSIKSVCQNCVVVLHVIDELCTSIFVVRVLAECCCDSWLAPTLNLFPTHGITYILYSTALRGEGNSISKTWLKIIAIFRLLSFWWLRGCVPPDFCFHGPGTRYLLAPEILPQVGNVRYIRMAFPSTTVATVMWRGHLLCLCGNWKLQTMVFRSAHCQELRTCSSISSHQTSKSRSRVGSWFETHYTKYSSNSLPKQFRFQPID